MDPALERDLGTHHSSRSAPAVCHFPSEPHGVYNQYRSHMRSITRQPAELRTELLQDMDISEGTFPLADGTAAGALLPKFIIGS